MKNNTSDKISKREFPGFTLQPKEGYYKLHKIGLTRERVRRDPVFFPARQSAKDFTTALQLAQVIAGLLVPVTGIKSPVRILAGAIRKALSRDEHNPPGFRTLRQENAHALNGLNLNKQYRWQEYIHVLPGIKRVGNNQCTVAWPSTMPGKDWTLPAGCTRLRIKATLLSIDEALQVTSIPWQQTSAMPGKQIWMPGKQLHFTPVMDKIGVYVVAVFAQWYTKTKCIPGPIKLRIV